MAHWCSFVWMCSTRRPASERSGHGAPVFTGDLLLFRSEDCGVAGSLRHVAGFPGLGLLRTLRPVAEPSADGEPSRSRPGRPGGWGLGDGSHVHHQPVDGLGAQLFPCSLATGTPQSFPVASWPATTTGVGVARPRACAAVRPTSARFEPAPLLEGVPSLVSSSYTSPSRLPDPGRLAVPARPVVVEAASHLPPRLRGQAASSFTGLLRQPGGGALFTSARSCGASWRTWWRRHSSTRFDRSVRPPSVQWITWWASHHDAGRSHSGNVQW